MWLKNHDHRLVNMHCNLKLCFDGIFNHILANKMTVFYKSSFISIKYFFKYFTGIQILFRASVVAHSESCLLCGHNLLINEQINDVSFIIRHKENV